MKIGIMTFWWSNDNYGQLLQCYALQKYLRDAGHDVYLIRYDHNYDIRTPLYIKFLKGLNPYNIFKYLKYKLNKKKILEEETKKSREFDVFRNKYIKQSDVFYNTYAELRQNPPDADVYIVGSDQVWNFSLNNISLKRKLPVIGAYMLNFGSSSIKRVSYAASWGITSLKKETISQVRPLLEKFDLISVREKHAIRLCQMSGRSDVQWVCDPTLLLEARMYRDLYQSELKSNFTNKKYIFVYILGNKCNFNIQNVYDFAQLSDLQVVYVTGNGLLDNRKRYLATIPEWLYLIDNADYIITNSFHCCIFSIIFGKKFGAIPLSGKITEINSRIDSLFEQFDIEPRWLSEGSFQVLERNYNVKSVDIIEDGKKFLESILQN